MFLLGLALVLSLPIIGQWQVETCIATAARAQARQTATLERVPFERERYARLADAIEVQYMDRVAMCHAGTL